MFADSNEMYLSNRGWFENVLRGEEVVLCFTSALECLELFIGYTEEKEIDVYAKKAGQYENINYRVVESFADMEIVQIGELRCTSVNQTINDMLNDFDNIDEQALVEALNCYYFNHNKSFSGLEIRPENMDKLNFVREWAVEYHSVG